MADGLQFHSELLSRAVSFVLEHHGQQVRKIDRQTPYVAHLVGVAFILQRAGCDTETVTAGLLHDVLEDTEVNYEELERAFGARIAGIVQAVTEDKRLPWEARKKLYIESVSQAHHDVRAVCAADKVDNLTSIVLGHATLGDQVWTVFRRGRDQQIGFYEAVLQAIGKGWDHPLKQEYARALAQVRQLRGPD
jgi:(p)ppGpp synthase/HD superfamily hydrolase